VPAGADVIQDALDAGAVGAAYWVNGDTGLKQTGEAAWQGLELIAEELAVLIPAPEGLVDDASFDLFGALRDPIAEAFAIKLDAAVFGGTDKPASWPQAIVPGAQAAGNADMPLATPAEGGIYGDRDPTLKRELVEHRRRQAAQNMALVHADQLVFVTARGPGTSEQTRTRANAWAVSTSWGSLVRAQYRIVSLRAARNAIQGIRQTIRPSY
jgi:HK97 family phage major capsid protein